MKVINRECPVYQHMMSEKSNAVSQACVLKMKSEGIEEGQAGDCFEVDQDSSAYTDYLYFNGENFAVVAGFIDGDNVTVKTKFKNGAL